MAIVVDGKKIAEEILAKIAEEVKKLPRKLMLAAILVGQNPASVSFLKEKRKACERIGILFKLFAYPETITTAQLRKRIFEIRKKEKPTALIVQLPLAPGLNTRYILDAIPPEEDADALSARSLGLFLAGKSATTPPTAGAFLEVLRTHGISPEGKYVVIVGWGELVGQPASVLFLQHRAAVTVLRSNIEDISRWTKAADIVVTGAGKAGLITGEMVKDGVVALDAGFSKIGNVISGDYDFASVSKKASLITPPVGGIGPITVAILLKNVVALAKRQYKKTEALSTK